MTTLSPEEEKGLRYALVAALLFGGMLLWATLPMTWEFIPGAGFLRNPETGVLLRSPFLSAIVAFIFLGAYASASLMDGARARSRTTRKSSKAWVKPSRRSGPIRCSSFSRSIRVLFQLDESGADLRGQRRGRAPSTRLRSHFSSLELHLALDVHQLVHGERFCKVGHHSAGLHPDVHDPRL